MLANKKHTDAYLYDKQYLDRYSNWVEDLAFRIFNKRHFNYATKEGADAVKRALIGLRKVKQTLSI